MERRCKGCLGDAKRRRKGVAMKITGWSKLRLVRKGQARSPQCQDQNARPYILRRARGGEDAKTIVLQRNLKTAIDRPELVGIALGLSNSPLL